MLIKRGGDIKSGEITDQALYLNRRAFMTGSVAGAAALALAPRTARAAAPPAAGQPLAATRNKAFDIPDASTKFQEATTYNNFYEFGVNKEDPAQLAGTLKPRPWKVQVDGLAHKPATFDVDDILKMAPLEERVYRLRCVEGWSMVIPWIGFPLSVLLKRVEPTGTAKYVEFSTLVDPVQFPGQRKGFLNFGGLDWPYTEGLRLDEALHPLTLLTVGMYGQVLPNQNGAPIRVVVPWKYGFKSAKSLVAIQFTAERPGTFWNDLAPDKYGFSSNVDPTETKPWPQSHETMLGTNEQRPTLPYNGYGEWVARLYA
jgi:sulfoxide reductase catalytic subunit YedY